MEMLSVSPAAWAFLLFIKTGHDPAEAFVLWPLEKKPSKCSKCLRLACVGSFQTVMFTLGPASAGVQSTVVTPCPCPEALLLQEGLSSCRSGDWVYGGSSSWLVGLLCV